MTDPTREELWEQLRADLASASSAFHSDLWEVTAEDFAALEFAWRAPLEERDRAVMRATAGILRQRIQPIIERMAAEMPPLGPTGERLGEAST